MSTIYSLESDLKSAKERLSLIASAFAVVDDPTVDGNHAANARQTIRDVLAGHVVHVVSAETYAVSRAFGAEATARIGQQHGELIAQEETIAKLTADNAALRENLKALRTPTDMEERAKDERDAARARLVEVEADRDRCVDACVFAASIFNLYASHHLAKGDHEKHARNNSYVERMRDAVNGRGAVGSLGELAIVHADLARVKAEAEVLEYFAKLTADNAALRAAAAPLIDAVCCGASDDGETAPAFLIDAANRCRQALASPNLSTGWVSPEEYARVVAVLAATKTTYLERSDEAAKLTADNAAMRQACEGLKGAVVYAERIFDSYARHHRATGAYDKWVFYEEHAVSMRDALASPTPAIEPVDTEGTK